MFTGSAVRFQAPFPAKHRRANPSTAMPYAPMCNSHAPERALAETVGNIRRLWTNLDAFDPPLPKLMGEKLCAQRYRNKMRCCGKVKRLQCRRNHDPAITRTNLCDTGTGEGFQVARESSFTRFLLRRLVAVVTCNFLILDAGMAGGNRMWNV
jgi:hypothetical protein